MMRLLINVFFCIAAIHAGTVCNGINTTTYLRSEGMRLMEFASHVIKEVTLNKCADSCTQQVNGIDCESFEYDASTQECSLHTESGQPFGPSVLAKATNQTAFFQKICIEGESLCPTPYSFERFPQQILIGYAMEVIQTNGLSECLSACLSALSHLHVPCQSVMYYYETGECIINRETKDEHPNLFTLAKADTIVDYFENNCYNVECYAGATVHWLRSEEFSIAAKKDVTIESGTIEECRNICKSNIISQERFPCRSFVFSSSKKECHLSAESGFSRRLREEGLDLSPISSGEYFEKYCLQSEFLCGDAAFEQIANRQLSNSSIIVINTPSVHFCLENCLKEGQNCSSVTFDYDLEECHISDRSLLTHPQHFGPAENIDYFDKICDNLPNPNAKLKTEARGTATDTRNSIQDYDLSPSTDPESFPIRPEAFTSSSTGYPLDTTSFPELLNKNEIQAATGFEEPASITPQSSHEYTHTMDVEDDLQEEGEQGEGRGETTVKAKLRTECRLTAITIGVAFGKPTSGAIFVKDHFATCRTEFTTANDVELVIPFPSRNEENPECPGTELTPSVWSFVVVVQRNEMDNPSLVTESDRTFNITCDYSNVGQTDASTTTTAQSNSITDEQLETFPNEEDTSTQGLTTFAPKPVDVEDRIRMLILKDGQPVSTVQLGEEVELRWIINENRQGVGYFVSECTAERMGGQPPSPEPLLLIDRGCPDVKVINRLMREPVKEISEGFTTTMKVFRFDGSRRVRLRCTIDVCIDVCPPVECEYTDHSFTSYGRKKRSMTDLSNMMRRFKPDFRTDYSKTSTTKSPNMQFTTTHQSINKKRPRGSMITGVLTVIDKDELIDGNRNAMASHKTAEPSPSDERVCLLRTPFVIGSIIFFLLFVVQMAMGARFFYGRMMEFSRESGSTVYSHSSRSPSSSASSICSSSPLTYDTSKETPPIPPRKHPNDRLSSLTCESTDHEGYTVPTRPRHSWEHR